ncbi:MAG TPA: hypothetical protein PLP34_07280, partial [Chitinophagaceae bacterium]|nr:hypothetical protein [Chitinophagaceae bacterium]
MKRISGLNLARTSMLDIIILYLLSGGIRRLAIQKGLPPGRWVLYMVLAWFCMELIGISIALQLFGLHPLKIILMALPFG